jgi:alpha-beta hydrolase superfamily lysophospholipase
MPHTEKTFVAPDAVTVFYRVWKATAPQKATLLFLHGFGEHSGRYEHVFKTFQDAGISVICPDHRGHGKTFELNKETMVKGYVPMAPVFAGYLKLLTEVEAELRGNSPVVVFGHSMWARAFFNAILSKL